MHLLPSALTVALATACLFTLAAPVAVAETAPASFIVYIAASGDNAIGRYRLQRDTGDLLHLDDTKLPGAPGSLALSADKQFLYAAVRSVESVATLRVNPGDGALKLLGTTKVAGNPVYITPDRSGKHLLTAYYTGNKTAVYPIAADGTVQTTATSLHPTGANPHCLVPSPDGRFVFVSNTGADKILQYQFDTTTGKLTPNTPPEILTPKGDGPRHLTFHPSGKFLYAVNEKGSSTTAFQFNSQTGALTALQTLPTLPADFTGNNTCADIEITPDGKFLYASNRGHDSLARYAIDAATGRLTALGHTPTEKTPREFAIDPTGRFLIAAGQSSNRLAVYRLDPATGALAPLAVHPCGKSPAWVLITALP